MLSDYNNAPWIEHLAVDYQNHPVKFFIEKSGFVDKRKKSTWIIIDGQQPEKILAINILH